MRITIAERLEAMEMAISFISLVEGSKPRGSTALWEATKIMYGKILSHVDISEQHVGTETPIVTTLTNKEDSRQKPLGLSSDMFSGQS